MRTQHSQHRSPIRNVSILVILVIALVVVTPVLAAYTGPGNRTVSVSTSCTIVLQECMFVAAKGDYRDHQTNSWSCSNESKPWRSYPSQPPTGGCSKGQDGYQHWEKEENSQLVTYQPATITGTLQNCTLKNGWCSTTPQLSLTTNEPMPGKNITAIEGSLNSQYFACTGASCIVPLQQGNNNFTYWADSSFNDTSLMGTLSAKVDTVLPVISGSLTGSSGSNGWYTGPVNFNGAASDDTSGVASFSCNLDGLSLALCSSILIEGEGPHTLVLTAQDTAGQTASLTQNTLIDTRIPDLNVSLSGTKGSDPAWYTSAALNGAASDALPGSGLSALEYKLDQNGWTPFPGSGELSLPDGEHTVLVRATDNAGLIASSRKDYSLDSVPPAIAVVPAGTSGNNNWFTTNPRLDVSASDETSGLKGVEYSLDNGSWMPYGSQVVLPDGIHEISFWAEDGAGLVSRVDRTYQVDTKAPSIGGNFSGVSGQNDWFTTQVTVSASAFDPQPGSGIDTFTYVLDGSPEDSLIAPLTLPDGKHTLQLYARDKAGLSYTTEQTVNVDTIPPALDIPSALPGWVRETVSVEGTTADAGSGLSLVEISTDGGQTWQAVTGTDSWSYRWDTSMNPNGPDEVLVRASDQAGLSTTQTLKTGVDNSAPIISLPDSWFQWDTITLDIQDPQSGLSQAQLEISDPEGRWPARLISLDTATFPMQFKWDRRFEDGSTAPDGKYDVKVTAADSLGNSSMESAAVKILINLPPGPTATLLPTARPSATATIPSTFTATPVSTATQSVVIKGFGTTLEPQVTATPGLALTATPRATPTQNNVVEWFESIVPSHMDTAATTTEISSPAGIDAAPPVTNSGSNVLWGAAAAAVISSLTAYGLEEKRKQPESETQAKLKLTEIEAEQRRKRIKKKQMSKLEAQWAQELAWEEARKAEEQKNEARYQAHMEERLELREITDEVKRVAEEKAERAREEAQRQAEEKKEAQERQAALAASYASLLQKENEAPKQEPNWWEKTKSFVSTNIIQPVDKYIYQPYIKPVVEKQEEIKSTIVGWTNKNLYQPYIEPVVESAKQKLNDISIWVDEQKKVLQEKLASGLENTKQFLASEGSWINQQIYQPYIKPVAEKTIQVLAEVNEKIYQPYIQPVVEKAEKIAADQAALINEKIYQPYIQPIVKKGEEALVSFASAVNDKIIKPMESFVNWSVDVATSGAAWVNENIYEPIFEPIVSDIYKYIYKPKVDEAKAWLDKYGEWTHNALDVVGFIPGVGDIADGINGLVYLAEGRYIEAGVSALAMIPLIGDLGKVGKWGIKLGEEAVEEAAEKVVKELIEQTLEEGLEEASEKVAKELVEQTIEEGFEEVSEKVAKGLIKETVDEVSEKVTKELVEQTVEESVETASKKAAKELTEKTVENGIEGISKEATKELAEQVAEKGSEEAAEKLAKETAEKLIKEHGDRAVKLLETVDPQRAEILLKTVDKDVLDHVIKQGPDAVEAFSKWSADDLSEHGVELALRAKDDANALANVRKLLNTRPIDPANLTKEQKELVDAIAQYSTQYPNGQQVVLGKWVDQGNGFVQIARNTGSLHYNPHPEMWKMFGELGDQQEEVAWLVNKQIVETGIGKDLAFEYTLNGVPENILRSDRSAIRAIFSDKSNQEIMEIFESQKIPVRIKELQELKNAGFKYTFDELNNSYIFVHP
jgi:hypothetical protein